MKLIQLRSAQSGFVLVTALMFMVILTFLGLSIMSTNTLGERMSGFFRDRQIAMEAAEAGLREAERDLMYGRTIIGGMYFTDQDCSDDGLCAQSTSGTPAWVSIEVPGSRGYAGWSGAQDFDVKSVRYGTYSNPPSQLLSGVARQPRYMIEAIKIKAPDIRRAGKPPDYLYRITAVGFGRRASTRVVLQAMIRPN